MSECATCEGEGNIITSSRSSWYGGRNDWTNHTEEVEDCEDCGGTGETEDEEGVVDE